MLFKWLKRRRRRRILEEPFPDEWNAIIASNVVHDRQLLADQQRRLREMTQVFVAEKNWEGCRGLEITDEVKVTIAALACLLVLGQNNVYFDHVLSILVYPDPYVAKDVEITRAGVVIEGGQTRLGEAWWRGPVILSWSDVLSGGRRQQPGQNLVFHEFAHQLDMMNGRTLDGTPPIESQQHFQRWVKVLQPEYERLVHACRHGRRSFIDCYAATNVAEYFAVITEVFFENSRMLSSHLPHVYDILRDYYRLDPAHWSDY